MTEKKLPFTAEQARAWIETVPTPFYVYNAAGIAAGVRALNAAFAWNEGFREFRRDRTEDCSGCRECTERYVCGGDSTHTWNFETNEPLMCYRDPGQYKH